MLHFEMGTAEKLDCMVKLDKEQNIWLVGVKETGPSKSYNRDCP